MLLTGGALSEGQRVAPSLASLRPAGGLPPSMEND
jgi:hypothetical protein